MRPAVVTVAIDGDRVWVDSVTLEAWLRSSGEQMGAMARHPSLTEDMAHVARASEDLLTQVADSIATTRIEALESLKP